MNLPIEFEKRMKTLLDKKYDAFLATFCDAPKKALQLNVSRMNAEEFEQSCDFNICSIPHIANGYYYDCSKIGTHPLHHAGVVYSQDTAAMLPVGGFPVNKDWKVLDLCAAPGGKTSQIAQVLSSGKGVLLSNEINPSRNRILVSNIERMGYRNVLVTKLTPAEIADAYPSYFDLILVDAPCSGEGMFRKYPESINEWSTDNVNLCANRQKEILDSATRCLRPGGYLIYSTWTYSIEEDEEMVDYLIDRHHFHLLPVFNQIRAITSSRVMNCQRCYPHLYQGEGQFFAYLQKDGNVSSEPLSEPKLKSITRKNLDLLHSAIGDSFNTDTCTFYEYQDHILALPHEFIQLPPHGITLCGVTAGRVEKGRFTPHHQLFKAYDSLFSQKTNLMPNAIEMTQYLTGNEINGDPSQKGYGVLQYCGCPIGGYKAVNGRLKNHYPKALRNYL